MGSSTLWFTRPSVEICHGRDPHAALRINVPVVTPYPIISSLICVIVESLNIFIFPRAPVQDRDSGLAAYQDLILAIDALDICRNANWDVEVDSFERRRPFGEINHVELALDDVDETEAVVFRLVKRALKEVTIGSEVWLLNLPSL